MSSRCHHPNSRRPIALGLATLAVASMARAQPASRPADRGNRAAFGCGFDAFPGRRIAAAGEPARQDLPRKPSTHQRRPPAVQLVQLLRLPLQWRRRHRAGADGRSMALWRSARPDLCLHNTRPSQRHAVLGRQNPRRADLGDRGFCPLFVGPARRRTAVRPPRPHRRRRSACRSPRQIRGTAEMKPLAVLIAVSLCCATAARWP